MFKIRWCRESDIVAIQRLSKIHNIFIPARFHMSSASFKNTLNSQKIFLVGENIETHETIGYILSKMKTRGVCFNMLLTVDARFRRQGLGGNLIIAMLKIMNQKQINGIDNPYYSFKWFAEVPAYNVEALKMYEALKFDIEGVLRRHTSAKTDIFMLAYFIDEKGIPEYGEHLIIHKPAGIDDSLLMTDAEKHIKNIIERKKKQKKIVKKESGTRQGTLSITPP